MISGNMNQKNENSVDKIKKKIKRYAIGFLLTVIFICIILVAIILPLAWLGNVVGGFFENIGNFFVGGSSAMVGDGEFGNELDVWQYNNRISAAHDEIFGCTMNANYEENHTGCFEIVKQDGHIDIDKLETGDGKDLFRQYMDDEIEEYYGNFDGSIRLPFIIPTFYQIGHYEEDEDGDEHLVIGAEVYMNEYGTGCILSSSDDVCIIFKNYNGKLVNPSNAPARSGLVKNYGFQISEDELVPSYNYYQEIEAGDVYAMAHGIITSANDQKIVIEAEVGSYDFTITYEGSFSANYWPNAIDGLPIPYNTVYPQDMIAHTNEPFKVYVQYDGKYINPALLYNVKNGWNFSSQVIGSGGVSGEGGATDVSGIESGDRAYITNQVAFDSALWSNVSFKLPFDKITISQCPEVIGWGDNGNMHTALDYYNSAGGGYQPAGSAISGVVVESGYNSISGYFITVEHESTGVRVNYNHLVYNDGRGNTLSQPQVGDVVSQGTPVGFMGDSGNVTGIHIHMNVYQPTNDEHTQYGWINPMWLLDEGEYIYMSDSVGPCKVSK